ncbi:MAG: hypothetical protein Kow0065_10810 [Methylomicrobium sp.]
MNWQEFFAMGGYAFYVWTSYGVTTVVLLVIAVMPIIQRKLFLKQLALKLKRNAKS